MKLEKEQREELGKILAAFCLLVAALVVTRRFSLPWWGELLCFVPAYLIAGFEVLKEAAENLLHGEWMDECFLMAVATLGAFAIGEYPEGVFVMVFYDLGEWFQDYAVDKSRDSIAELMDIRPDCANLERDGKVEKVDPHTVNVGDVILIQPGERVPLDGVVVSGASSLDTAALTGEALPRDVEVGGQVISGCVNLTGVLRVRVEKPFGQSTVSKILDLVEHSSEKKAAAENFITKFARYYTPAVVIGAVLVAVIPSLVTGDWLHWVRQALTFLVISCPCALVISVPLSFFGGLGAASRQGVLVKGSNYLEALAKTDTVVFDKTGTLTQGTFAVAAVHPEELTEGVLIEIAALAEGHSTHPIAQSLRSHYGKDLDLTRVSAVTEQAGRGVSAQVDGETYYIGNDKLMESLNIPWKPCEHVGTIVHIATRAEYLGHIVIADRVKDAAAAALRELKKLGVKETVMLTGDAAAVGEAVARELGLDKVYTQLLPQEKVERMEELLERKKGTLLFVGDGVNDAPVLARADVGIAMGALGSDAAIEAADVVLMDDKPSKIAAAIRTARRTVSIARQNIAFSLAVKAAILVLGVIGLGNLWLAVFADVGVALIATLNALRCLKTK